MHRCPRQQRTLRTRASTYAPNAYHAHRSSQRHSRQNSSKDSNNTSARRSSHTAVCTCTSKAHPPKTAKHTKTERRPPRRSPTKPSIPPQSAPPSSASASSSRVASPLYYQKNSASPLPSSTNPESRLRWLLKAAQIPPSSSASG